MSMGAMLFVGYMVKESQLFHEDKAGFISDFEIETES